MDSNSETQGYNFYPMLLFHRKFSNSVTAVKLELPSTVRIHPVVNVSRIHKYIRQVEGQKKEQPAPVIIEGEEEWEVERILNK